MSADGRADLCLEPLGLNILDAIDAIESTGIEDQRPRRSNVFAELMSLQLPAIEVPIPDVVRLHHADEFEEFRETLGQGLAAGLSGDATSKEAKEQVQASMAAAVHKLDRELTSRARWLRAGVVIGGTTFATGAITGGLPELCGVAAVVAAGVEALELGFATRRERPLRALRRHYVALSETERR
jgi:hypothetical protein